MAYHLCEQIVIHENFVVIVLMERLNCIGRSDPAIVEIDTSTQCGLREVTHAGRMNAVKSVASSPAVVCNI